MTIDSTVTHKNGGFEQGILQIMNDEGLLKNESDKNRLDFLKSLPRNRTEIINSCEIKQEAINEK